MLILEILFNTVIKHHRFTKSVLCVSVLMSEWLTSDQPEHIPAELECEIQRVSFVSSVIGCLNHYSVNNCLFLQNKIFLWFYSTFFCWTFCKWLRKSSFCRLKVHFNPQFIFFYKWKLATGRVCSLWAFSGLGASAFCCPLSLHFVFFTVAQLLGFVFPSLPVFASGGWGVSAWLLLLQGALSQWTRKSFKPESRQSSVWCVWGLWKMRESSLSVRVSIFLFWPD